MFLKIKKILRTALFSKQRAFTILESLVAISIFTTGVSAAMFVITQSINVGARTKSKIIAAHLAQEGIEVVRNIRDRNWDAGNAWNAGIVTDCGTYPCSEETGCVEHNSDAVDAVCVSGQNLLFDGSFYTHTAANSQFSRTMRIAMVSADHMVATSTVTCGAGCSIVLAEDLFNWK